MHELISKARKNLIKRYNIKFTSISISDEKDYYFSYHAGNLFIIFLYEGNISQNYPKGIIAVDFVNKFNKLRQCPIFCSIDEPIKNVYQMIDTLSQYGELFSNKFLGFAYCPYCKRWFICNDVKDENVGILRLDAMQTFSYYCFHCKNSFFKDTSANE